MRFRSIVSVLMGLVAYWTWALALYPVPAAGTGLGGVSFVDPWDKGFVLDYLFFTANPEVRQAAATFLNDFNVTAGDEKALRSLALDTYSRLRALPKGARESSVKAIGAIMDSRFRSLVGARYSQMRIWLRDWLARDAAYREQLMRAAHARSESNPIARLFGNSAAASDTQNFVYVFATQFGTSGYNIAIPDWEAKFATLGISGYASPPYNYGSYPAPY